MGGGGGVNRTANERYPYMVEMIFNIKLFELLTFFNNIQVCPNCSYRMKMH